MMLSALFASALLTPSPADVRACSATIGAAAARARVAVCRDVSPATRPPCNAANSCAMIEEEIARSCALFADGAPMPGCTVPPHSAAAAADVVRRYYSAIAARDYATAWQQWGHDGPPGQPLARFAAGYARTRDVRVTVGVLPRGDAGAGSAYQTVPVAVDALLADGTRQRFAGTYTLRRVMVDDAPASTRRWHIDGARLRPVRMR